MPDYLIVKPCIYVKADGVVVQHNEGGSVRDIPEDVAKGLGDAVRPMVSADAPDLVNPTPFPDATVSVDGVDQGPGKRGRTRTPDAEPGETDG
jgi:hypothetical protein